MKITKRQLRRIISEAYSVGDPDVDNLTPQLYTADARKGFKPDINKMNKLKDTKFEMNTLNQFVKDFFDDSKPEFDSKQLVIKILNMKQAADQGIGYDENQKKDIEKALELAEEATGFVASDSYLTQAGEEHFGKDGRDPYIEKSTHFRRQGITENSKSLNRRHLRRLIKEELTKKLLRESQFRAPDPQYRGKLFLNYGGSDTSLPRDVESSSGTYDVFNAPDWDREEPWFNDARMFSMTLGAIDNFYRMTKGFQDLEGFYQLQKQWKGKHLELANFILEKIANAKAMISQGHEFIHEPVAISIYLNGFENAINKKLNTLMR